MHRIAKFHFVSPGQFLTAMQEGYPQYTEAQIKEMYENLKLPRRATKGSAGYDFFAPFAFTLAFVLKCRRTGYYRFIREADWALNTVCR